MTDWKLACRMVEQVSRRSTIAQFGGNSIEMHPHSATCFDSDRRGMREHFVLPATWFTLPCGSLCHCPPTAPYEFFRDPLGNHRKSSSNREKSAGR